MKAPEWTHLPPRVRRLFRFPWRSAEGVLRDCDDELRFHLQMRAEELVATGLSRERALLEARRQFGDIRDVRSHAIAVSVGNRHRERAREIAASIGQDLRFAGRQLRRSPLFATVAVLTLALGIGACTTIFGVVDAVLLRSLPFHDLDRLIAVAAVSKHCPACDNVAPGHYLALREHSRAFASVAGYGSWSGALLGSEGAEHVDGVRVTPNFFATLGVAPALGRTFAEDSASPVLAREVMLSDALWRTHFGSDPRVVGSTVRLSGDPYTVIAVMPAGVVFPSGAQLWLPLAFTPSNANDLSMRWLRVFGRLAPGVTAVQARREVEAIGAALESSHEDQAQGWRLESQLFSDYMLHQMRQFFAPLMAAALFVLLIVCANVANLLLARTSAREREIAVRRALGAGRWRLARQLFTEIVLLAMLGAACGALLAWGGVPLLKASVPASITRFVPGWNGLVLNGRALLFAIALSMVSAFLVGVFPALRASGLQLTNSLREGGHGTTGSRGGRIRRILVVAEFALALVLLVSAGLMVQSVRHLVATSTGMRVEHVLTMSLELPQVRYTEAKRAAALSTRLQSVLSALPGVRSVAAVTTLPLSHDRNFAYFNVSGEDPVPIAQAPSAVSVFVTPHYFETLGIALLAGRDFTAHDDSGAPPVAIINEKMAKRYWPGANAVGQGLDLYGKRYQIIGVAADVRDQMESPASVTIYQSELQIPNRNFTLAARVACPARTCDARALAISIRAAIASIDRDIAVASVRTMPQVVAEYVSPWRLLMGLLSIFAALALLIAAVGIYGVMMYAVVQRTHEIGIRMALGADRGSLVRMVVRDAGRLVGWGAVFGIAAALAVTRVLPFMLYQVSASDPGIIGVIAALLAAVALLASWLPARRATAVDPMIALRSD